MDEGKATFEMCSLIKRNATKKALDVARKARDMLGANGLLDEHHIMRHMTNLESKITSCGSNDVQALILGKTQTGISAFG